VPESSPSTGSHFPLPHGVPHTAEHVPAAVQSQWPWQKIGGQVFPRQSVSALHSGGGRAAHAHTMMAFEAQVPASPPVVVQSVGLQ
jgi:hypothetical protein